MYIDECLKDKITYSNLHQYLKLDHEILYSTENAFILKLLNINIYVVDCFDSEVEKVKSELEKYKSKFITTWNDKLYQLLQSKFKYTCKCYQTLYCGEQIKNNGNLMHLKKEDLEYVRKTYNKGENVKEVEESFKENNILGYYENGKLIGFVGRHIDHSIGMLYVKEEFRRKGYGSIILKLTYSFFEDQIPFTHIIVDNIASLNLHKKIGCHFGKKYVYWLCNEEYNIGHYKEGKCRGFQFFQPKDDYDIKLMMEGKITTDKLSWSQRQLDVDYVLNRGLINQRQVDYNAIKCSEKLYKIFKFILLGNWPFILEKFRMNNIYYRTIYYILSFSLFFQLIFLNNLFKKFFSIYFIF